MTAKAGVHLIQEGWYLTKLNTSYKIIYSSSVKIEIALYKYSITCINVLRLQIFDQNFLLSPIQG